MKAVYWIGGILITGTIVGLIIRNANRNGIETPGINEANNFGVTGAGNARAIISYKGELKEVFAKEGADKPELENKIGDFKVKFFWNPVNKRYDRVSILNKKGIQIQSKNI